MSSTSSSSGTGSGSDEDEGFDAYRKGGYHAVRVGDQFAAGRYIAQRKLGWGNFSTVWLAFDTQSKKFVALKIQKSAPEFAQAALHEIEFLSEITSHDPQNRRCILQMLDHFKHLGPNGQHLCLVFEFLGDSLLGLIKYNRYKGIGLNRVRQISKDILIGLDYLHQLGIIHTDLKPENVLLISTIDPSKDPIRSSLQPILDFPGPSNPNSVNKIEKRLKEHAKAKLARISKQRPSMAARPVKKERDLSSIDLRCKIVDFGNACWKDKQFGDIIQTRQYRAPEVVIGLGYGCEADMWSFGCIVYELATGDVLFSPKEGHGFSEDEDHLALMMELLGKMPKKIAISGSRSKEYFDRHGDLKRIRRLGFKPLDKILMDRYKFSEIDALDFMNFLSPLLDFDPLKRPSASECLSHPWLQINKEDNNNNNDEYKNINIKKNHGSESEKVYISICGTSNSGNSNIRSKSEIISKFNNKVHNTDENDKEKNKSERNVNEKEKIRGEINIIINDKEKIKEERVIINEKEKSKGERVIISEKEKNKGEKNMNVKEIIKGEKNVNEREKVVSNEDDNLARVKKFASRFNEKINQNKINNINNNINLTRSKTTRETNINIPPAHNNNPTQNTNNSSHSVNTTNNNVNNNIITHNNNNENVNNNNNTSNNNEPIGRVAIAMSKLGVSGRINSRRIG